MQQSLAQLLHLLSRANKRTKFNRDQFIVYNASKETPMHIREKIAHVIDVKHLKHETLAKPLGISRQAFSKRLKHGNFTDREITILAKEMNMEKEALENVDPQRTEQTLQGVHNDNHTHNNNIVLSYVMNLTFNGMDDSAIEKIVLLVKDLQKLQQ